MLLNIRTIATNFSPVLGVLRSKPVPKYCNVWYERCLCFSQWSDTGPSWPSCFSIITTHLKKKNNSPCQGSKGLKFLPLVNFL